MSCESHTSQAARVEFETEEDTNKGLEKDNQHLGNRYIEASSVVSSAPPSATSVPTILKTLKCEYDSIVKENVNLKQQLEIARENLSESLCQHTADSRLIARLSKEVTATREALAAVKPWVTSATGNLAVTPVGIHQHQYDADVSGQPMEEAGMTPEIIQKIQNEAKLLQLDRMNCGNSTQQDLAMPEIIQEFQNLASYQNIHSESNPAILAIDVSPSDTTKILTGGNDKNVTVFNKETEQVVTILKGHREKITSVIYHPDEEIAVSGSFDSYIRIWHIESSQTIHSIKAHEGGITSLSLHATSDYVLSTSTNDYWAFSDLRTGQILTKVGNEASPHSLTTAQFHPNGLIFATGLSNCEVHIWSLIERAKFVTLPGHLAPISAIAFSTNGFTFATSDADSVIKLWDLRKIRNFHTITFDEAYELKSLCFDKTGSYLAVAGSDIRIYDSCNWNKIKTFYDNAALVTGVKFGKYARFLASVSMDGKLKIYRH